MLIFASSRKEREGWGTVGWGDAVCFQIPRSCWLVPQQLSALEPGASGDYDEGSAAERFPAHSNPSAHEEKLTRQEWRYASIRDKRR
jgi:hypothetical protein